MSEFMRNSDAFTWAMESDPRLRSTVVTVLMLDRTPDWGEVCGRVERLSHEVPMMRQVVVETPPPAPPRWQDCTDFDLDFHMRRVAAPQDGTFESVLEMARLAQMEDFDRARPMWKLTLIEGLSDGRAAVLCCLHHALTDGVGAVQIAMTLFGLSPELPPVDESPTAPPQRSALGDYKDAARYSVGLVGSAVTGALSVAPRLVVDSVLSPRRTLGNAAGLAASVYRTVRPVNATGSPLMTRRTMNRRLGILEIPMPPLRDAAHRSGGALNDAFVAGVAGGLRHYHEKHGAAIDALHLSMPISLRSEGDAPGGNRITLMRFDIPAGLTDPGDRIRAIHARTEQVRREKSLPYTQAIAGVLNLVPRWYIGSILRHVDFVASDVPGIPVPVSLGGAKVLMQYAFGPTIGAAVNITLLTYVDTCALGIDADTGAIPDIDVFCDCLRAGFDEVLAVAAD